MDSNKFPFSTGGYCVKQQEPLLIFCPVAVILSLLTLGGMAVGMDSAFNLIMTLSSFCLAAIPLAFVGLRKMALCTSKNFPRFITSVGSTKQIYLGIHSKRYCDAFNYTFYSCIFVLAHCFLQILDDLPLKDKWVIIVFNSTWRIIIIGFYLVSLLKVRWKVYAGFSFLILAGSLFFKPFFQWLRAFVTTAYELSEYVFLSVAASVLCGVFVLIAFSVYRHYLAKCVAVPIYLTEAPSVVKLVTQDGLVLDRSEVLFYPDFDKTGVTITFYNGKKTKYYRYEELVECTVVGEDGRKLCIPTL